MKKEVETLTTQEKIFSHLLKPIDSTTIYLTIEEQQLKKRWSSLYVKMMDNPFISNKDLVLFLTNGGFGAFEPVKKATAYNDINIVKSYLGDIKTASKSWIRHLVYEALMKAYHIASEKNDSNAITNVADKLGKYFKLDKDDLDQMDWNQFPEPNFEPSANVSIIGLNPIKEYESRRKNLRKLLKMNDSNIQDAEVM